MSIAVLNAHDSWDKNNPKDTQVRLYLLKTGVYCPT